MNKVEKDKIFKMLDTAVDCYFMFRNRDDYPDKPCVRRETIGRQSTVFNLADYLCRYGFITWEQCCEYWSKVGIIDEIYDEKCIFTKCTANKDGVCEYMKDSLKGD